MAQGLGYDAFLSQCAEWHKPSLNGAPGHIGNFSDKQIQQVVDFVGELGMHEWEGTYYLSIEPLLV
jgi:hypothetical protein